MALIFQVGGAANAFEANFAPVVIDAVRAATGYAPPRSVNWFRRHTSVELGWSWVADLQRDAQERCGAEPLPHLQACDSWMTVYLPVACEPCRAQLEPDGPRPPRQFVMEGNSELAQNFNAWAATEAAAAHARGVTEEPAALVCASAAGLLADLARYAAARGIAARYADVRRTIKDDSRDELQAFAALLRASEIATRKRLPLWVVK